MAGETPAIGLLRFECLRRSRPYFSCTTERRSTSVTVTPRWSHLTPSPSPAECHACSHARAKSRHLCDESCRKTRVNRPTLFDSPSCTPVRANMNCGRCSGSCIPMLQLLWRLRFLSVAAALAAAFRCVTAALAASFQCVTAALAATP